MTDRFHRFTVGQQYALKVASRDLEEEYEGSSTPSPSPAPSFRTGGQPGVALRIRQVRETPEEDEDPLTSALTDTVRYSPPPGESSPISSSTRFLISSRMGRTASTPCPAGSGRVQSR